jgi:hypothetical protein
MSGQDEAKVAATAPRPKDGQMLRFQCLDLALRMPQHGYHSDVVKAAREFEKFVIGEPKENQND